MLKDMRECKGAYILRYSKVPKTMSRIERSVGEKLIKLISPGRERRRCRSIVVDGETNCATHDISAGVRLAQDWAWHRGEEA